MSPAIKVADPVNSLLFRYARLWHDLPEIALPAGRSLCLQGRQFELDAPVEILLGELSFCVRLRVQSQESLESLGCPWDSPVSVTLEDGSTIEAEHCFSASPFPERSDEGGTLVWDWELDGWVWAGDQIPVLWVTELMGPRSYFGNLVYEGPGKTWSRPGHRAVLAEYPWYLASQPKDPASDQRPSATTFRSSTVWRLFRANSPAKVPTRRTLYRELLTLHVAFGIEMAPFLLQGLNERGDTVALMSFSLPSRPAHRAHLWNITNGPSDFERAELVRCILDGWTDEDDLYLLTLVAGLAESVGLPTLDGRFRSLHIALESAAKCLVSSESKGSLLKDRDEWIAWLREHRPHIESFVTLDPAGLVSPAAKTTFFNKLMTAGDLPSSRRTEMALKALGLAPPDDLLREIRRKGRPKAAHEFIITTRSGTLDHLEKVQALATAMLARRVGYCGPLRDPDDPRKSPDWWPVDHSWDEDMGNVVVRGV